MEKRLLIFDLGIGEIVAGAYIDGTQESVLRLDPESEWEAWIEEFISDHLATGRCIGVAATSTSEQSTALKTLAAKLDLDLQFVDHPPLPTAIAKLYPGRDAIVIHVNSELLFTQVRGKEVKEQRAPLSVETIQTTVATLREALDNPVVVATGHAMSELAADAASAHLREALTPLTDAIEPELSLIGIHAAHMEGETHV